jgi:hypothetical protein
MNNCRCCCNALTEQELFLIDNLPIADELVKIKIQKDALEAKEKALRNKLLTNMNEHHIERVEFPSCTVIAVEDSNFNKVDTTKLKKQYPSTYYACAVSGYKESYLILRVN